MTFILGKGTCDDTQHLLEESIRVTIHQEELLQPPGSCIQILICLYPELIQVLATRWMNGLESRKQDMETEQ